MNTIALSILSLGVVCAAGETSIQHVYAGRTYDFSFDAGSVGNSELKWRLVHEKLVVDQGNIDPGDDVLTITFPEVVSSTEMELSINSEGEPEHRRCVARAVINAVPFNVSSSVVAALANFRIGIYEESDNLSTLFNRSTIPFQRLEHRWGLDSFDGDLILIGRNAINEGDPDLLDSLQERIANGAHVLLLPQQQTWSIGTVRSEKRTISTAEKVYWRVTDTKVEPMALSLKCEHAWCLKEEPRNNAQRGMVPLISTTSPPCVLAAKISIGEGALWATTISQCGEVSEEPAGLLVLEQLLDVLTKSTEPATNVRQNKCEVQ